MKKRIIITGAAGFVGKHLISHAPPEWEIIAVVRKETDISRQPKGAYIIQLDLYDYSMLGELAGPCDAFIHLAWNGARGIQSEDPKLQNQNLRCSIEAIESILKTGTKCIILAGSQAEYGPHRGEISEGLDGHPVTEYGKAKLALYQKTVELCEKLNAGYKEARIFSLYGPDDNKATMISQTMQNMLMNRPCQFTKAEQMWDFLYIEDAVNGLIQLCDCACPNGIYNLGSGTPRKLRDYIDEMAQIIGTESELFYGAIPYPETGMLSLQPDISKLVQETGWVPSISFPQGIKLTLQSLAGGM